MNIIRRESSKRPILRSELTGFVLKEGFTFQVEVEGFPNGSVFVTVLIRNSSGEPWTQTRVGTRLSKNGSDNLLPDSLLTDTPIDCRSFMRDQYGAFDDCWFDTAIEAALSENATLKASYQPDRNSIAVQLCIDDTIVGEGMHKIQVPDVFHAIRLIE